MANRRQRRYTPDGSPPAEPALRDWLLRELTVVATLLDNPRLTETFTAPAKPEAFVLLLADGTSWNPGFGRGVYFWDPNLSDWYLVG